MIVFGPATQLIHCNTTDWQREATQISQALPFAVPGNWNIQNGILNCQLGDLFSNIVYQLVSIEIAC